MADFMKAWRRYGKGRVLCREDFFDDYLAKTADITRYFSEHDNTPNPLPLPIWDTWIELYGSPDSLSFPGLPNNLISSAHFTNRVYRMEVMAVVLPADEAAVRDACRANACILEKAAGRIVGSAPVIAR